MVAGGPKAPVGVNAPAYISLANQTAVTVSGSAPSAAVSATVTLTDQARRLAGLAAAAAPSGELTLFLD